MAPIEVVKNGGGWACVVISTVFAAFSFRPASPKNSTSLSNNVMISWDDLANIKIPSANLSNAGLWVAENRTRAERNRSKIVSKLKKFLIELGNMNPKDVMVSYKVFKVVVRVGSKLIPLASVDSDMEVHWHDAEMPSADVKKALEEFIANME